MPDVICDDRDELCVRFQCRCGTPGHAADVMVQWADRGQLLFVDLCARYENHHLSPLHRLVRAWLVLRGKSFYDHSFTLNEDDTGYLISMLQRARDGIVDR